ncbi:MAG: hypothetical protein QJR09_08315 [Micrococcus sp.]|nr:hypothetical protein [Micrococcus sp.]
MTSAPDGPADDPAVPPKRPDPDALEHRDLVVRRAPKVQVFLLGGALLGVLAALVVALIGPANPEFTLGSIFGYFVVIFGIIGVGVGGLVWLALDRRSRKHARTVHARAVTDPAAADYAVDPSDLQQWREKWDNEGRDDDAR